MTIDTLIMLFGAFVAILPFLGFPNSVDEVLFTIAGFVIVALGIIVRRKGKHLIVHGERRERTIVEHVPGRDSEMRESPISAARMEAIEHERA